MKKRTQSKSGRARTWFSILACVAVLACGFFLAARQHFSTMDFGMKNSRLRKQIDDLESEKRRLLLAREVSLSPAEIKKAALKARIAVTDAVTTDLASLTSKDKPVDQVAVVAATTNPLITKTVATAAAIRPIAASLQKPVAKPQTIDKKLVAKATTAAE